MKGAQNMAKKKSPDAPAEGAGEQAVDAAEVQATAIEQSPTNPSAPAPAQAAGEPPAERPPAVASIAPALADAEPQTSEPEAEEPAAPKQVMWPEPPPITLLNHSGDKLVPGQRVYATLVAGTKKAPTIVAHRHEDRDKKHEHGLQVIVGDAIAKGIKFACTLPN
jgi:hypothetical protein